MLATLATAVGVTAAAFNLADTILLRSPAGVRNPDTLVRLSSVTNYVQYEALRTGIRSVDLAGYSRATVTIDLEPEPVSVRAECVTDDYFKVLGTAPHIGSLSTTTTDSGVHHGVVILSYGFWNRAFGGTTVLSRSLTVGGQRHTVIGVAPRQFSGVELEQVDIWLALNRSPDVCSFTGSSLLNSSSAAWLRTIGRIRTGFTRAQTEADVAASVPGRIDPIRRMMGVQLEPLARSGRSRLTREERVAVWIVPGAFVVLVIAWLNVAMLLALRASDRRMEVALRLQVGATAIRVFFRLFGEASLLVAVCTLAAVVVAQWTDSALRAFFPGLPDDGLSVRSLVIVAGFGVLAGIASALIPLWQVSRSNPTVVLRGGYHSVKGLSRSHTLLLVTQLALVYPLLMMAGLLGRSLNELSNGAGFQPEHVIVATLDLDRRGRQSAHAWSTVNDFLERVERLPSVSHASASSATLLSSGGAAFVTGVRGSPGGAPAMVMLNAVTSSYFEALGTRVMRGRGFSASDRVDARLVLMADEGLAAELWPGQDAIGKCAYLARVSCIEVVGITESRRTGVLTDVRKEFFVSANQASAFGLPAPPRTIFIRVRTAVADALPPVVSMLQSVAPEVPRTNVRPLASLVDHETRSWRLGARAFALFGLMAALMGAAGVYSALALALRQRTPEIALRMALGATAGAVVRLVVRYALVVLATGAGLGVLTALLVGSYVRPLLFEVEPTDLMTHLGVVVLILTACAAGTVSPVIRAIRLDPARALRDV
jgi:predicted permease